jgi:ABC-type multidrug transport system fused ATPase/permease subunit
MNQSTKFLISVIKENRKEITKIMLIATLGSVMTVITPYVYGKLFDLSIIPETSVNMLVSLIMIWMVLGLVSTLLSHSTSFFGSILGMKIALKTEAEIYGHFIKLPVSFHKKHRSGEILHRISRGTWSMQTLIEQISYILPQALMLVFSLIAMILVRWELALIISLSFFLYIVITLKMTKSIMKIQEKEHRQFERRYGEVYDKLYNIPMIKNYVKEEKEKVLFFNALVERLIPMVRYSHRKSTKLSIIQDTIYNVSFVMVLGVAIFFLRAGSITPGQFVDMLTLHSDLSDH